MPLTLRSPGRTVRHRDVRWVDGRRVHEYFAVLVEDGGIRVLHKLAPDAEAANRVPLGHRTFAAGGRVITTRSSYDIGHGVTAMASGSADAAARVTHSRVPQSNERRFGS